MLASKADLNRPADAARGDDGAEVKTISPAVKVNRCRHGMSLTSFLFALIPGKGFIYLKGRGDGEDSLRWRCGFGDRYKSSPCVNVPVVRSLHLSC